MGEKMHLSTLSQILEIDNFKVQNILYNTDNILKLYIVQETFKWPICHKCGKAHNNIHDSYTVQAEDLSISGKRVFLIFKKRNTLCPVDGSVRIETFDWLKGNVTKRFAENVYKLTSITTNTEAGWYLGVDDEKVYRIDKKILEEKAEEKLNPIPGAANISVDEVAWQKWYKYITNIIDIDEKLVIWNHKGRGKETMLKFYDNFGDEKSKSLLSVALDGASGYINATREKAPQALLVYDRFHINQKLNNAIDQVRRDELRAARKNENKDLVERLYCGERWILLKNKELTEYQQKRLDELVKLNENIAKAKLLKDDFLLIYKEKTPEKAESKLIYWLNEAETSGLIPFKELSESFSNKFQLIINYFKRKISSAISEGFNNKIKRLKRMAYGYRDPNYFLLKIHQHCGLLNPRYSN